MHARKTPQLPNPDQRIARMRKSFERDKSVLTDDSAYFTAPDMASTPRASIHQSKAAHKSAERSERRFRGPNETRSSGKTDG